MRGVWAFCCYSDRKSIHLLTSNGLPSDISDMSPGAEPFGPARMPDRHQGSDAGSSMGAVPVVMLLAVLAVLAGVVVVATGRGGEMSQESADYAPLDLGKVSATDVVLLRPPTTVWGYSMQITEEALEKIATAIRERDVRIIALEQRIADLTGQEHYAPRPPGSIPGIGLKRVPPPIRPVAAPPPAPLPVPEPPAAEDAAPEAAEADGQPQDDATAHDIAPRQDGTAQQDDVAAEHETAEHEQEEAGE
jgi:hypothetical protein